MKNNIISKYYYRPLENIISQNGKVHSVYRNTINILVNDYLISIVNNREVFYNGIVLENFDNLKVNVNDELYINKGILNIGDTDIYLKSGAWDYQIKKDFFIIGRFSEIMEYVISLKDIFPSAKALYIYSNDNLDSCDIVDEKSFIAAKIIEYFNECDRDSKNFLSILGLGLGLTPTGDDIIAGRMLVEDIKIENFEEAIKKTNEISQFMLKSATKRYHKYSIMQLINYIYGENISIEDIKRNILTIGYSSGIDTVVGILYSIMKVEVKNEIKTYS